MAASICVIRRPYWYFLSASGRLKPLAVLVTVFVEKTTSTRQSSVSFGNLALGFQSDGVAENGDLWGSQGGCQGWNAGSSPGVPSQEGPLLSKLLVWGFQGHEPRT